MLNKLYKLQVIGSSHFLTYRKRKFTNKMMSKLLHVKESQSKENVPGNCQKKKQIAKLLYKYTINTHVSTIDRMYIYMHYLYREDAFTYNQSIASHRNQLTFDISDCRIYPRRSMQHATCFHFYSLHSLQ